MTRNRVAPDGAVVDAALRCRWMGNRGCLHEGRQIVRHHVGRRWIVCETSFGNRRVPQWAPGRYTVLFFHDEAVALAAGHRPCAECRRPAYRAFLAALDGRFAGADDLDRALHAERRAGPHPPVAWADLPDGAFVDRTGTPHLVVADRVVPWAPSGYGPAVARPPTGTVVPLTPPTTLAALRGGYVVQCQVRG